MLTKNSKFRTLNAFEQFYFGNILYYKYSDIDTYVSALYDTNGMHNKLTLYSMDWMRYMDHMHLIYRTIQMYF
jgi:hypothetical protein